MALTLVVALAFFAIALGFALFFFFGEPLGLALFQLAGLGCFALFLEPRGLALFFFLFALFLFGAERSFSLFFFLFALFELRLFGRFAFFIATSGLLGLGGGLARSASRAFCSFAFSAACCFFSWALLRRACSL